MLKYFRNRETVGYLVGSFLLMLVIVAFVAFYIPDFFGPQGAAAPDGEVARVEGISISAREFLESYRQQERMYRAQLGDRYSPEFLRQLGLEEIVLQSLVQDALLVVEARRQGLTVTDEELRDEILRLPMLQSEGGFIGQQAYLDLLARNSISAREFEEDLRLTLLRDKLRRLVTDGVLVSPEEVEREYRRRNEKASLRYLLVPSGDFRDEVEVSEEEVATHYESNQEDYRLPQQRKIRYVTITTDPFQAAVQVSDREIERYYQQNLYLYEVPEQVRASHILFRVGEEADEEAVRKKAESVLAEIRGGADFAALAKEHSEDASAEQGGDLGFFGRGDMVPQFEEAAFSLEVEEVSEPVRSPYGFHIIKVTEKQPPLTRPLEDVREEIRGILTQEKARAMMEEAVQEAAGIIRRTRSLEAFTQNYPQIKVEETDFFGRQDPIAALGGSPELRRMAFELSVDEVSPPVRIGNGYAFFKVLEERAPHIPPLEEIRDQIREDLVEKKALEMARRRAEELRKKIASGQSLEKAAGEAEIEVKTTESFYRGTQLPETGRSAAVQEAAFSQEPGSVSAPLRAANGYVLLEVAERTGYSPEEFAAKKAEFTQQYLEEKRQQLWGSYVEELRSRHSVQIDRETLRRLTG